MLTSKQRAALRGMANGLPTLFQVGKAGVTPELVQAPARRIAWLRDEVLPALGVLDNCLLSAREAAEMLSGRTRSEVVQVIGSRLVLYRKAKKPVIELPKG